MSPSFQILCCSSAILAFDALWSSYWQRRKLTRSVNLGITTFNIPRSFFFFSLPVHRRFSFIIFRCWITSSVDTASCIHIYRIGMCSYINNSAFSHARSRLKRSDRLLYKWTDKMLIGAGSAGDRLRMYCIDWRTNRGQSNRQFQSTVIFVISFTLAYSFLDRKD
jgi:hypothetical protein